MRKKVQQQNVNAHNFLLLLEAEHSSLSSAADYTETKRKYDEAIVAASKLGFKHIHALASELAASYCIRSGDTGWGTTYIAQAVDLYKEWGAEAKVTSVAQTL